MIVGGGGTPARNLTRHEVQRPRPPHVAAMSTPPACAALRIVVPMAVVRLRHEVGSFGSAMIVSATAMAFHSSGMLAPMEIPVETLRRLARLGGFAWTDAELEAIRPGVQRLLETLERLETLPLDGVEPTTQYRLL